MRVLQERRLQGVVSRRADEERARANRERAKTGRDIFGARESWRRGGDEAAAIFDAGGKRRRRGSAERMGRRVQHGEVSGGRWEPESERGSRGEEFW